MVRKNAKRKQRKKNPAAVALGRKGGKAALLKLSKRQRQEKARRAAIARWKKAKGKGYQPPP